MPRRGLTDRSTPGLFSRDPMHRIFSGRVRDRLRGGRRGGPTEQTEDPVVEPSPPPASNPSPSVLPEPEFSGANLRVRNYILGISESAQLPVEEVQESRGVKAFAESLGVDLERVKFTSTEEE